MDTHTNGRALHLAESFLIANVQSNIVLTRNKNI